MSKNLKSVVHNHRDSRPLATKIVMSRAGNPAHKIDDLMRLRRFLIIGTSGSTFYASKNETILDNLDALCDLIVSGRGSEVLALLNEVSVGNLAMKPDPLLMSIALCMSVGVGRAHSNKNINRVTTARDDVYAKNLRKKAAVIALSATGTPTKLFALIGYVRQFRGTGRLVTDFIHNWFASRDNSKLAYQAVKYRQRDGWTLRDMLRLSHYRPSVFSDNTIRSALLDWIAHRDNVQDNLLREITVRGKKVVVDSKNRIVKNREIKDIQQVVLMDEGTENVLRSHLPVIDGYYRAKDADINGMIHAIETCGLPWEALPTEALKEVRVWRALMNHIGMTALLRNLGRLGSIGFLNKNTDDASEVIRLLSDKDYVRKSGVHPFAILVARSVYESGSGVRGSLSWTVNRDVVRALDVAFELSFGNVQKTGKLILQGVDVSGSMWSDTIADSKLTPAEAAIALALISAKVEDRMPLALGFTASKGYRYSRYSEDMAGLTEIEFKKNSSLSSLKKTIRDLSKQMGATDATLVIRYAIEHNLAVDTFVIYTDNENNSSPGMVTDYLRKYRQKTGIDARLVSVAFTATSYSVADATDPGQMDIVGFDASAPQILSSFIRGEL